MEQVEDFSMLHIQAMACLKESFEASLKKDWAKAEKFAKLASKYGNKLADSYKAEQ